MMPFVYNPPKQPYLRVVYQDRAVIVVDKPSGLLSVPGRFPQNHDSVLSRVRTVFPNALAVHRLDLDTAGLMVIALNNLSARNLGFQFEKRLVKKSYLALAGGIIREKGRVELPLRCDWEKRPRQIVDSKQGKYALTFYEPLETFKNCTLVKLIPHTGRSHQLRVHMAEIGHPLLGDRFYGAKYANLTENLCLASVKLDLTNPVFLTESHFTCDHYQNDFQNLAKSIA
ncbi:MAG: RNA pseudouridine synthase [Succinivibrio sp.]|nr:RNA pseudouridine synthase [Succinivibrio sp.]